MLKLSREPICSADDTDLTPFPSRSALQLYKREANGTPSFSLPYNSLTAGESSPGSPSYQEVRNEITQEHRPNYRCVVAAALGDWAHHAIRHAAPPGSAANVQCQRRRKVFSGQTVCDALIRGWRNHDRHRGYCAARLSPVRFSPRGLGHRAGHRKLFASMCRERRLDVDV